MLLFWQSKITRFWQVNLNVKVQFPLLSSCLRTKPDEETRRICRNCQQSPAAVLVWLYYLGISPLLKISNWWWWAAHCVEQAVLKWLVWAEQDHLTAHMFLKSCGSQAAPSICSGCHCISKHAIIAFPAEIQYIPNESHSADLTITGHSAQLWDQHNPSTVVNFEEKRGKKKRGSFHLLNSIAR